MEAGDKGENSNSFQYMIEMGGEGVYDRMYLLLVRECSSKLQVVAKLLHEKPKHASGEATSRDKRKRKPEKKK